jgi:membrane AbrB-like protein
VTQISLRRDIIAIFLIALIAIGSGFLFELLDVPAPILIGSMFGVWLIKSCSGRFKTKLYVPRWCHKTVVLGLGVMMGAMFDATSPEQVGQWGASLLVILVTTSLATGIGYLYLVRIRRYPKILGLFCSIPGGQAELIALSRDFVDKDYVVALFHMTRVVLVFTILPVFIGWALSDSGGSASQSNVNRLDLSLFELALFLIIAGGGYLIALICRTPIPHLFGPLVLSLLLHVSGWVNLPRIDEFVLIAQVIVGGGVGARLGSVGFRDLSVHLGDALINVLIILIVFGTGLWLTLSLWDSTVNDLALAFVPGGIYEITLLTVLFGFDTALVTIHHSVRMLFIIFMLPTMIKWVSRSKSGQSD